MGSFIHFIQVQTILLDMLEIVGIDQEDIHEELIRKQEEVDRKREMEHYYKKEVAYSESHMIAHSHCYSCHHETQSQ